jgi:cytoskeletal protein CcmA (bactofilin family)
MALFSSKDTPPSSSPRASEPQTSHSGSGTFFGPNVTIDGTVTGSESILIEGTVRGKINVTGELRIGTKARIEATVHAKHVTVEGKLTGDVSADDRVELVASSTVEGNIKAPKIIVAEGARFRGSVDMGSAKPNVSGEPAAKK